jgi:hypothetical protein
MFRRVWGQLLAGEFVAMVGAKEGLGEEQWLN